MNKFRLSITGLATLSVLLISSCKKSTTTATCDGTNSTYNGNVKTIIDNNCTDSGCHNSGSNNGDFTNFLKLKSVLENGKFKTKVLDDQTMPKGSAKLSSDELNKIKCWSDSSFPEK